MNSLQAQAQALSKEEEEIFKIFSESADEQSVGPVYGGLGEESFVGGSTGWVGGAYSSPAPAPAPAPAAAAAAAAAVVTQQHLIHNHNHNPQTGGKRLPQVAVLVNSTSSTRKRKSTTLSDNYGGNDEDLTFDDILAKLGHVAADDDRTAIKDEDSRSKELAIALEIIDLLMAHDYCHSFRYAVDPIALNLPDYLHMVKRPMDLTTLKSRIESMDTSSSSFDPSKPVHFQDKSLISSSPLDHLVDGVGQTIKNCYIYNPKGNPIRKDGWLLLAYFDSLLTAHTDRRVNWRRDWGIDDFRAYDKIVSDKRRGPNRKSGRQPKKLSSHISDYANEVSFYSSNTAAGAASEQLGVPVGASGLQLKKRRLNAESLIKASFPAAASSLLWSILAAAK